MEDRFLQKLDHSFSDADIKLTFFLHLSAYLAVNSLLIAINLHGASNNFWAKWPILVWGFILLLHIIAVLRAYNQKQGNIRPDMLKKGLGGL